MGKDLTRSVYLIDTENQHDYWMKHIKSNTSNDKVILFCSVNSPRVTFQLMQTLYTSFAPRQVEYVETYPGKNSQDFFIIGKLGQLITTAPKSKYYIVSEDKGYDAYLYSLVEQGYKTFRLEFSSADVKPSNAPPTEDRCKSILLRTIDAKAMVNEMTMLAARASGGVWTGSKKTKLIQDFSQDGRNNLIIELKQF